MSLERLQKYASELEPDAQEVLCLIAQRLLMGQQRYGRLDIRSDTRDWRKEALEEIADGLVYWAIDAIKQMRR